MNKFILKTNIGYEIPAVLEESELVYGVTAVAVGKKNSYYKTSCSSKVDDDYAYHPKTNEKLEIVVIDDSSLEASALMLVPLHVSKHFELAKKFNLPLKQVVAPYFFGEGEEKIQPNVETQFRQSVIAVIKNPKNEKYLCVSALKRKCNSFVMGGIEGNENPEDAALREVMEETGYDNIKITRKSRFVLHNHFYASYKGINRYAWLYVVFGELRSESQIALSKEESSKQKSLWLSFDELADFLSVNNNIYVYKNLMFEDKVFELDGMMINSRELDGMLRSEAKKRFQ